MMPSWIGLTGPGLNTRGNAITANMPKGYDVNPKRDRDGLTKPQQVFRDKVLEVGPVKAAEAAYPGAQPESQRVIAHQNMTNPVIVSSISRLADAKGLTKDACLEKIKDGLEASNVTVDMMGRKHETTDHKTRLKAAELGLRVHGELKNGEPSGAVPITKDLFVELCSVFWGTKPGPQQP